jgi:hypothetical protein
MSIQRILRLASLGAILTLAAACSDDPSGPKAPAAGTFRSDFSGDYASKHSGAAVFGVDGEEGSEYFALLLGTDEDDMANIVVLREGVARLEVGTHQVANTVDTQEDDADEVEMLVGIGNSSSSVVGFLDGKSGTVTITRSAQDGLAGSFDIVAEGLIERNGGTAQPATVRVSGAFSAVPVTGVSGLRLKTSRIEVKPLSR